MALSSPVRILIACLLGLLVLPASALAVKCGSDRCRTFDAASGSGGDMAAGPDGAVWFVGDGFIGRVTPSGDVKKFPAPTTASSDIESGADGGIWFSAPGVVGRMDTSGSITEQHATAEPEPLPTTLLRLAAPGLAPDPPEAPENAPAGTTVKGPDGAVWFVRSHPASIGRIDAEGHVTEYGVPSSFGSELAAITSGPDNGLWFTAPKGRMVGRISPKTGHVLGFHTSWNPYAITAGPSHAIWFAMTDSGRWTITRMVPAGYMSFFQVPGPVKGLQAGPDDGIYISHGSSIQRLEPFIGAYPIRSRKLKVNPFAGSTSMRLYCSWYDLVSCAGKVVFRWHDQVVAKGNFSQRVNDAPATRLLLNGLGRRVTRRSRNVPVTATVTQHDQGGTTRVRDFDFTLVRQ
jgi:streptogramin lyase